MRFSARLIIPTGSRVINKEIKVHLSPTCTICLLLIWFPLEYGGVHICIWHLLEGDDEYCLGCSIGTGSCPLCPINSFKQLDSDWSGLRVK